MNGGQRGEVFGIDEVVGLYAGVGQLGAQHMAESITGQPRKEGGRYAEAPQTDGHVEAGPARRGLVRQVPAARPGRREVDQCIARHDDRGVWIGSHTEVSRTASSNVRAASAVVGSVKN